jgi:hypothetical protein
MKNSGGLKNQVPELRQQINDAQEALLELVKAKPVVIAGLVVLIVSLAGICWYSGSDTDPDLSRAFANARKSGATQAGFLVSQLGTAVLSKDKSTHDKIMAIIERESEKIRGEIREAESKFLVDSHTKNGEKIRGIFKRQQSESGPQVALKNIQYVRALINPKAAANAKANQQIQDLQTRVQAINFKPSYPIITEPS